MGERDRGGGRGERAAREGSRATSPLRRALGRRVLERLLKGGGRRGGLGWVSTWLAGFFEKNIGGESLGRGAWKSEFRASSHLAAALNDRVSARADVVAHNANAHHRLIADATPGWEVPFKKVKTKQGGRLIVRSRRRSRRVARGKEKRVDRPPSSRVGARISRGRTTGASAKPASRVPGWMETEGTRAIWSFRRESTHQRGKVSLIGSQDPPLARLSTGSARLKLISASFFFLGVAARGALQDLYGEIYSRMASPAPGPKKKILNAAVTLRSSLQSGRAVSLIRRYLPRPQFGQQTQGRCRGARF